MLAQARASTAPALRIDWQQADIAFWTPPRDAVDVLFSNAALHWQNDHAALFPRLFVALAAKSVLAVQMPDNFAAPSHRALADTVRSARWRSPLEASLRPAPVAPAEDYFRWLAPQAEAIDVWTTEYVHVLMQRPGGEHPVVAWMRGTALTPYLSQLDAGAQAAFVGDLHARIAPAYPALPDGRVLYPFRRRFIVAIRANR
jgi:trans-aconitate 2-methyltransferase